MLKLVLGASGSGKTTLLYARIRARAEAGKRSILLVPEQFTSSTEARIYRELGDALSGMVESYSFTSLAEHILAVEGGAAVQTLTDAGRAVLVRRALEELQDNVHYYYRHRRSAAFCQMAAETIDELKSAGLSGQQLQELARDCGSESAKLGELALIFQGYESLLAGTGMDPADRLELAADRLEAALARDELPDFLREREVFIDEFDTFNAPKKRLMGAMLAALPEAIANRDAAALKALQADCAQVEAAEGELANYAVELLSAGATSERQAAEISDLMFIVDAAGRIGSRCGEAAALYGIRLSSKKPFSDEAREELAESAAMVADMYDAVLRFLSDGGTASEQVLDERRRQIVKRQSRARKAHFRRVGSRQCAPENKAVYNQLLLCLERAGNECSNLVEHGAELSMWGDALGADRPGSHDGGAPPVAKRSEAPVDELAEALA